MKHCIVLLFFSMLCYSQSYKGAIGDYEIFMEIDKDYDNKFVSAFYFYDPQLQNIPLEGNYDFPNLILFEKYSAQNDPKELFNLKFAGFGLDGTWQNGDEILDVYLKKTAEDFEEYKSNRIEFIRDSVSVFDNKELVWFTEKYSQESLFRLGNGFPKNDREFFNGILDSIHLKKALISLECESADFNVEVKLVSDKYISFSEWYSIFCGGAHPNHGVVGYNLDLHENKVLDKLEEVFPKLDFYSLLKNKYKEEFQEEIDCDYFGKNNIDIWDYSTWVLTKEGIEITPSFPHVLGPCEIPFLLEYMEIGLKE